MKSRNHSKERKRFKDFKVTPTTVQGLGVVQLEPPTTTVPFEVNTIHTRPLARCLMPLLMPFPFLHRPKLESEQYCGIAGMHPLCRRRPCLAGRRPGRPLLCSSILRFAGSTARGVSPSARISFGEPSLFVVAARSVQSREAHLRSFPAADSLGQDINLSARRSLPDTTLSEFRVAPPKRGGSLRFLSRPRQTRAPPVP